jgi:tRNA pseudouridine32 synthase/23S rRNA pseudouridine746 synthase/23S rRNA pseudouridine1911/1915/1917 synthase
MTSNKSPRSKHQPRGLDLLYEDDDLIVVNKPCGILTMGTDRDKSRTVHTILNDYVRKGNSKSRNRIYIVHRLDRDTSGVLIFAKSERVKLLLQEQWKDSEKKYLTVVYGEFAQKEGLISSYLAENSAYSVYSTPDSTKGKLSHTAYKVLKETKGFSLLEIHLLTGRKHQIRVHLAEKGHPVVGDKRYGKVADGYNCLALHARSLSCTHPVSGKRLFFETPPPEYFTRLVGRFDNGKEELFVTS